MFWNTCYKNYKFCYMHIFSFGLYFNQEKELKTCIQAPRILKVFAWKPLAGVRAGERVDRPNLGEVRHRRRGKRDCGARGSQGAPNGVLGRVWDGRSEVVHCEQGDGGGEEWRSSTATVLRRWIGGAEKKGGVSVGGAVAEVRGDGELRARRRSGRRR